jgi:hypothetical protein
MGRLHVNAPQLIAFLLAATTLFSLWGAANTLVRGALVALLLPLLGLVLTAAIFPGQRLGGPERLLYALTASIAAIALTGLVLDMTPWGLESIVWTVLLAALTAIAGLVAWLRRPQREKPLAKRSPGLEPLNLPQASLFGLSAVMLGLAVLIARVPASADGYQGYSMLSILPAAADTAAWRISVDSKEFSPTTYSLVVYLDDEIVYLSPNFTLAPHGHWQTQVDLSPYAGAEGGLAARLYRSDAPGVVYRQVLIREPLRQGGD